MLQAAFSRRRLARPRPPATAPSTLAVTLRWCTAGVLLFAAAGPSLIAAEDALPAFEFSGAQIYATQCAKCHGPNGEGVEDYYPDALRGDRSLEDLARVIHETMPEDDPEKCIDDDAKRVAEYIYGAFYSPAAQAGLKPPRIELARLTVRQYQNAVSDLVGSFLGTAKLTEERGLSGRYHRGRGFRRNEKVLERLDPRVAFHFGEGSPDNDKIDPKEFAIQWQGGVIAPETGDYEFVLKTENGARLYVNDDRKALIDAWVHSGDMTEHRATIRLLGGLVYPIRLDYSKANEKTASIELYWLPPRGVEEVVPARCLAPGWFPPRLVVETEFPPDDSSMGYVRGTSVSQAWDQATTYAAIEIAGKVAAEVDALARTRPDAADRTKRLQEFCHQFTERAFRRPISHEDRKRYIDNVFDNEPQADTAVKKVIVLVLKSPRFLYLGLSEPGFSRVPLLGTSSDDLEDDTLHQRGHRAANLRQSVGGTSKPAPGEHETDCFAVAERLAFGLWDSLPDDALLRTASEDRLKTPEQVAREAERMLTDPRTKTKLRAFFHHWLDLERFAEISKDQQLYPGFDAALAADLRTSLDLSIDNVIWSGSSDFRELLVGESIFVNRRIAEFYKFAFPADHSAGDDDFSNVALDPARYAGLLTHPCLTSGLAYHSASSPIHRGVFLARGVLGRMLKPPPIAVTPADEGTNPQWTTRQRVAQQTSPPACQTCHEMINPLGFALEHFDAAGRFREEEKQKPIDASGHYHTLSGETANFVGGRALAEFLATSEEVHRAFVEQVFHHLVKQPTAAYGPDTLENLRVKFTASGCNVQKLLVEIVRTTALKGPQ
ncbi:MAG: DUF1592 domain-containing protein [Planctomycetota bacterium]